MRWSAIVLSLASATIAHAEPLAQPQTVQSFLPQLLTTAAGTTIEARVDYTDADGVSASILNAYLFAQHLTPQGFGGYAAVPLAFVEEDDSLFGDSGGGALGNVEVGGLFLLRPNAKTDVLARAGIAIDTAPDGDDLAMFVSTVLPRLTDAYTSALQTTWGRAQGQLRYASHQLRLGAALGFDVPLAGDAADAERIVGILNGVLAAGVQKDKLGLGASLVLIRPFIHDQPGVEEDTDVTSGLNLSIDYLLNPNARFLFTIGFSLEDNVGNSFGLGLRFSTL